METTVVNERPSRVQLANTERVSGCKTRVLKSTIVVLEKGSQERDIEMVKPLQNPRARYH